MKKVLLVVFYCLTFSVVKGLDVEYPVKDESLARILMLFEAELGSLYADDPKLKQYQEARRTVGYQDFPAIKRVLEDKELPYNNWSYQLLISYVSKIDGSNMRSTGDVGMMQLTRKYLTVKSDKPDWQSVVPCCIYLSQKGDARDLSLLKKYSSLSSNLDYAKNATQDSFRILQARVAGTNFLANLPNKYDHYSWSTNLPPFLPSVVNTGPQAVYVYDLLKQALSKYGSPTNIPSEVLTLIVTFNSDRTPVCNIDLSKYGLVMTHFETQRKTYLGSMEQVGSDNIAVDKSISLLEKIQKNVDTDSSRSISSGCVWVFILGTVVILVLIFIRIRR